MKLDHSPEDLAERLLGRPYDQLDVEEQRVLHRLVSDEVELDPGESEIVRTGFGDRLADRVAAVGGSWPFIVVFVLVVLLWMLINSRWAGELEQKWDEYPYIFLNFVLSLTAALQAPVIMMSQNRQAAKDRISSRHDYEINLRTTVEILQLGGRVEDIVGRLDKLGAAVERVEHEVGRRGETERI